MLNQTQFSAAVIEYLKENRPEFLETLHSLPDGSFHCTHKSPAGTFSIWIATYDREITVGLEAITGNSDCHTHFTAYEHAEPEGMFQQLDEILAEVYSDRLLFCHNSLSGFSWTSDIADKLAGKKPNEVLDFFSWTEKLSSK